MATDRWPPRTGPANLSWNLSLSRFFGSLVFPNSVRFHRSKTEALDRSVSILPSCRLLLAALCARRFTLAALVRFESCFRLSISTLLSRCSRRRAIDSVSVCRHRRREVRNTGLQPFRVGLAFYLWMPQRWLQLFQSPRRRRIVVNHTIWACRVFSGGVPSSDTGCKLVFGFLLPG